MSELSNYRAVGLFDLLSAPITPIGAFDAEQFKKDVRPLLDKGSNFVAVDLTGLDFLYSDACSAFNQARQELSSKGGAFALLTDNDIVVDCLRKAGLDKSLLVFRKEADMMAFSMKEDSKKEAPADVKSENQMVLGTANVSHRRVTGRFTKSFNAIRKDSASFKGGLSDPFKDEDRSKRSWLWMLVALLVAAGAIAFFSLQ